MGILKVVGMTVGTVAAVAAVGGAGYAGYCWLEKRKQKAAQIEVLSHMPGAKSIFPALDATSAQVRSAFGIPPATPTAQQQEVTKH
jgi:uncharacterized membrane protein YebE (DUF533 family)